MHLTNVVMTVENAFNHEIALLPASIFNDDGNLGQVNSKADLKRTL